MHTGSLSLSSGPEGRSSITRAQPLECRGRLGPPRISEDPASRRDAGSSNKEKEKETMILSPGAAPPGYGPPALRAGRKRRTRGAPTRITS